MPRCGIFVHEYCSKLVLFYFAFVAATDQRERWRRGERPIRFVGKLHLDFIPQRFLRTTKKWNDWEEHEMKVCSDDSRTMAAHLDCWLPPTDQEKQAPAPCRSVVPRKNTFTNLIYEGWRQSKARPEDESHHWFGIQAQEAKVMSINAASPQQ